MVYNIAILRGDGIGPEVMQSALKVLNSAGFAADYTDYDIGLMAIEKHKSNLPDKTVKACKKADAVLLGATQTPSSGNIKSATVRLRREMDVYANIRPCFSLQDESFDFVIFRENTEGMYSGIEKTTNDKATATRVITKSASERIIKKAFEFAKENNNNLVTIVHKANVLRETCGLFRETALEVAKDFSEIKSEEMLVDACGYRIVKTPQHFQVIVTTNLFGDILSDVGSAVMGSLGVAASANIGETCAIFEPVHGSAPDIVGKGVANPTGMILSSVMMLSHLGEIKLSKKIKNALLKTIREKNLTPDLGGKLTTKEFTEKVISNLNQKK